MSQDDKYPESSGRRRFVKGVVGSASLAAVGTTGAVAMDATTHPSGAGGGTTRYFGVENTDGPAPRAMPLLPLEIDGDGYVKGVYPDVTEKQVGGRTVQVAEMDLGGTTYTIEWYQYCGVQTYQGLQPSYDKDNYLRYANSQPAPRPEYSGGEKVNINDFDQYETWGDGIGKSGLGQPAMATWRSQDVDNAIPVHLLRSTRVEQAAQAAEGDSGKFLQAATSQGLMAWVDKCTHFCCTPGFKATSQSVEFGAADEIYCPCHQSVYDPFSIVQRQFVAYPRPEGN